MAKSKEKGKQPPTIEETRENFEYVPREDVPDALDVDEMNAQLEAEKRSGVQNPTGVKLPQPSLQQNPYLTEEDQGMELAAKTVGPPQYGSPDPATAAGALLTLEDGHPLDMLPEGHPAAISEDYAAEYAPGQEPEATDSAKELAAAEDVDLRAVQGTGKDGKITKDDVENYVAERDGTQS